MEKASSQLETRIEAERQALRTNCDELELRFKAATDWRGFYKRHTGAMVAAAFGGGIVLATMLPGRGRTATPTMHDSLKQGGARATNTKSDIGHAFDNVKGALIAVAATRVNGLISDLVPGFAERMAEHQERHSNR